MISLDEFRKSQRSKEHALGRLLRERDDSRGLIHTPAEIAQQPWLWRETAKRVSAQASKLRTFLSDAGMYNSEVRPTIALTGAGTSDYVGLSISDLLRRALRTTSYNWPTTRVTAFPDAYLQEEQKYLIIHFARSGESPESKAVLKLALRHFSANTRHVVITCNPDGALAQLARKHADSVYLLVLHEACNDRGLAMTSSFTNMVVAGQALAYLESMDMFLDVVDRTAHAANHLIEHHADDIFEMAEPNVRRVFYLGNVDQLGAAVESALKTQEMTAGMVTASGEDTLALRHGPISAVDASSVVCFFLSAHEYTQQYELDVIRQFEPSFHEMGARLAVVAADRPVSGPNSATCYVTYDPEKRWNVPPFHQVGLSVLFGQLFGLFACYRRGLNADNPAVDKALYSRTVQGVTLYDFDPTNGKAV